MLWEGYRGFKIQDSRFKDWGDTLLINRSGCRDAMIASRIYNWETSVIRRRIQDAFNASLQRDGGRENENIAGNVCKMCLSPILL